MTDPDVVQLGAGEAEARIALRGAEPVSWRIGGRDLLWSGDPAHWSYHAPILFPLVGASKGGVIRIGGKDHPMPQHGFARTSTFSLASRDESSATFVLTETKETLAAYPFRFSLEVTVTLSATSLRQDFTVTNRGQDIMPYGLGVHPAFPWPLGGETKDGHRVVFEKPEMRSVPEIAEGGLLARQTRNVPLQDNILPLAPELFTEALVFLDAQSHALSFQAPSGEAIKLAVDEFPHLAVWSRPDAPFLSLEAWSAHADWEDASGKLAERDSMTFLKPGEQAHHRATMSVSPAGGAKAAAK
ncbi:aldose 1-epimerase family protein [Enterovirga rhinocerotis]|uniref:Galactose mutarotase-like enzyme n=1 Tax=Enterovirga rhinocerotis TaxID=1339210 RepID=A0A4R7BXT8_9HYPH|nr:aldose 1-epimerase family protein [Enterovirga rhinocerotis]TDR90411.1 galactose mutarotase-like enzyme [Enterovirga rhinocerotis]